MKISHVKISNLLGVESLEFSAGAFNVISGPNGSGKTTVLEAIKAVLGGGHDATLLRKGQERGEVVLVLDDGTEVRKAITEKGSTPSFKRDGKAQPSPQAAIRALTDSTSFNAVEFIDADKKRRVDMLLGALPAEVDETRIQALVGDASYKPVGSSALAKIECAYKAVYDDRTGTNRAVEQKRATIAQLEQTLPQDDEGAVQEPLADLELRLENIETAYSAETERITKKLAGLRDDHDAKIGAIRARIAELQAEITAAVEAFADIERRAGAQRELSASRYYAERNPILASVKSIRDNQAAMARADQTRNIIATQRKELTGLEADARRQTEALAALQAYKAELMDGLPVDGLAVDSDGNITRHGIVFDRLNEAQRVDIAVEIAKLRAGELAVICVDGLERLDAAHLDAFREKAQADDIQLFITRVSDTPFQISKE